MDMNARLYVRQMDSRIIEQSNAKEGKAAVDLFDSRFFEKDFVLRNPE